MYHVWFHALSVKSDQGDRHDHGIFIHIFSFLNWIFDKIISLPRSIQFNSPYSQLFFFSFLPTFSPYFSPLPTLFGPFLPPPYSVPPPSVGYRDFLTPIDDNRWVATTFVWLSIGHRLADANRCQLTNKASIDRLIFRLSVSLIVHALFYNSTEHSRQLVY